MVFKKIVLVCSILSSSAASCFAMESPEDHNRAEGLVLVDTGDSGIEASLSSVMIDSPQAFVKELLQSESLSDDEEVQSLRRSISTMIMGNYQNMKEQLAAYPVCFLSLTNNSQHSRTVSPGRILSLWQAEHESDEPVDVSQFFASEISQMVGKPGAKLLIMKMLFGLSALGTTCGAIASAGALPEGTAATAGVFGCAAAVLGGMVEEAKKFYDDLKEATENQKAIERAARRFLLRPYTINPGQTSLIPIIISSQLLERIVMGTRSGYGAIDDQPRLKLNFDPEPAACEDTTVNCCC